MIKSRDEFDEIRENLHTQEKTEELRDFMWNNSLEYDVSDQQRYIDTAILSYKLGEKDRALSLLEDGLTKKGYWFHPRALRKDNFAEIFDTPEFKKLYDLNLSRRMENINEVKMSSLFEPSQVSSNKKLAIFLNGNYFWPTRNMIEQDMDKFRGYKEILGDNYALLVVASDEAAPTGMPIWYNADRNALHVNKMITKAQQEFGVDWENTVIISISAGSGVLVKGILNKTITPKNIVLINPAMNFLMKEGNSYQPFLSNDIKVLQYTGENDFCLGFAKKLDNELTDLNHNSHQLTIEDNLGHGFPEDVNIRIIGETKKFMERE